jgi:hypothetical protein
LKNNELEVSMARFLSIILGVIVFLTMSTTVFAVTYSGGSGISEDPYQIATVADWRELIGTSTDWDKHFVLLNDINFSGINLTPVATDLSPDYDDFQGITFTGVFDGNGHILRNAAISLPDSDYVGLFGFVATNGTIHHLGVADIYVQGGRYIGGLAGYNNGTISDCHTTGRVLGYWSVGGLVGFNNRGMITNSFSTADINGTTISIGGLVGFNEFNGTISNCMFMGSVSGEEITGGLVGANGGRIFNCYSTGSVSGASGIGGLVGNCDGIVSNCFSTGRVQGSGGGLVGRGDEGIVMNSYWDIQTSGCASSVMGIGRTTQQMKQAVTFLGWNSCDKMTWTISEGQDYPHLLWEGKPEVPLPTHQLSEFLSGSGTHDNPYLIYTAEQFNTIGQFSCEWDKHFSLMLDLDLSGYSETEFHMIGGKTDTPFAGVFDGQGHVIVGFHSKGGGGNKGLFRFLGTTGNVRNLGLESADVSGSRGTGSLVGYNYGTIANCYSTGGEIFGNKFETGEIGRAHV